MRLERVHMSEVITIYTTQFLSQEYFISKVNILLVSQIHIGMQWPSLYLFLSAEKLFICNYSPN